MSARWGRWATVDRYLAAAVLVAASVQAFADRGWRLPLTLMLALLMAVTLAVRRTRPELAILLFAIGLADDVAAHLGRAFLDSLALAFGFFGMSYSAARYSSRDRLRPTLVLMAVLIGPHLVMYRWAVPLRSFGGAAATVAMVVVTTVAGLVARRESERGERIAAAKRTEQRTALARDVHDTIAHHLSAIALQADAAALLVRSDPDRAETLLRQIHGNARDSLDEIRSVIGMLRVDPTETAPGIDELSKLGSNDRRVLVRVASDVGSVPLHVSTAIYRIGQEAIANARRHARDARQISVTVDRSTVSDHVVIEVRDDGQPAASRGRDGWGLVGIAERVALLGGSVQAGPDARGGWTVRAELPIAPEQPSAHDQPVQVGQ
jgi:signal transduction histidine kinase